jgi:hypothetical protein
MCSEKSSNAGGPAGHRGALEAGACVLGASGLPAAGDEAIKLSVPEATGSERSPSGPAAGAGRVAATVWQSPAVGVITTGGIPGES